MYRPAGHDLAPPKRSLALVDHFNLLDGTAQGPKRKPIVKPPADKLRADTDAGCFLTTHDAGSHKFFDQQDLHGNDRSLFTAG